ATPAFPLPWGAGGLLLQGDVRFGHQEWPKLRARVVLLHVMTPGREPSRQALPGLIAGLRAQGYRFVTVPELLALRGEAAAAQAARSR
ncbi:MAG: hypothetical protein L0Y66_05755, partial [Myxococcaceae bacterium]|nr:hypothetical protein [Myxococcaceae bacterium]